MRRMSWLPTMLLLWGCADHRAGPSADGPLDRGVDHALADQQRPPGDGAADAGATDSAVADALAWDDGGLHFRAVSLPACNGKGPGTEDCHARLFIDSAACSPAAPCERMVVYWSGGEQSCSQGVYDGLVKTYAAAGYVAACAQPYSTSEEAGAYPYNAELERMHELMAHLRGLPEVKAVWTGDKLLISGVSHGATAPLAAVAAAQALKSRAAVWTGKLATALVLYDGISNPATLEEWTGQQQGCSTFHARFVGRYGDGKPLLHSCQNNACYCSSPAHQGDWAADTTVIGATYPPGPYSCADFTTQTGSVLYRFVSCSGGLGSACGNQGDIIPDAQQKLAHDGLQTCPGVVASYKQYPNCAHTQCGGGLCGLNDSLAWLTSNGF